MKIMALKKVYWYDGFEKREGKVKTVSEHHAEVVCADGTTHMVAVSRLSTTPLTSLAGVKNRTIISG